MARRIDIQSHCGPCGRLLADGHVLCTDYVGDLILTLHGVDDLVGDLDLTLSRNDRQRDPCGGVVGKSAERPIPFNEGASEAAFTLSSTLVAWARDAVDPTRAYVPELYATVNPKDPAKLPDRLTVAGLAARVLVDHIHVLANSTEAGTAYDEIMSATGQARRVVDRPAPKKYIGKCAEVIEGLRCAADLYVTTTRDTATCPGCGTTWDVDPLYGELLAKASEHLGTAAEVAGLLRLMDFELKTSQVHQWARSGKLERAGTGQRGWPLYRFLDVLDLTARQNVTRARGLSCLTSSSFPKYLVVD